MKYSVKYLTHYPNDKIFSCLSFLLSLCFPSSLRAFWVILSLSFSCLLSLSFINIYTANLFTWQLEGLISQPVMEHQPKWLWYIRATLLWNFILYRLQSCLLSPVSSPYQWITICYLEQSKQPCRLSAHTHDKKRRCTVLKDLVHGIAAGHSIDSSYTM